MPSAAFSRWQNDRLPNLAEVDRQCAASLALAPSNLRLIDENLRGYVLLLSAHFQGFCRDLYSEGSQIVVSKIRPTLQLLIQAQFSAHQAVDHGNPNLQNIRKDFERFGFTLNLIALDPANSLHVTHLGEMNQWCNIAAHHGTPTAAAGMLTLPRIQAWRSSCHGLAQSLDAIMYNELRRILKRTPW